MAFPRQEPVETTREDGTVITSHPAFACISASRVSGGAHLYGSDIQHQYYMVVRISKSEMHRHLANDWHHADLRDYIEIAMSESQWQQFVSSPNTMGTQCTLQSLLLETIPQLPPPKSRKKQFHSEALDAAQEAFNRLDELLLELDTAKLSNTAKKALAQRAESVRSSLTSSMPFILDQFNEHMEDTVNRAKTEINGYAAHMLGDRADAPVELEAPQPARLARSRK